MTIGENHTERGARAAAPDILVDLTGVPDVLPAPASAHPAPPVRAPADLQAFDPVWLDVLGPGAALVPSQATIVPVEPRNDGGVARAAPSFTLDTGGSPETAAFLPFPWWFGPGESLSPAGVGTATPYLGLAGDGAAGFFSLQARASGPAQPAAAVAEPGATTAGSDVPIVTFGEIIRVAEAGGPVPQSNTSHALINADHLLSEPRFLGIDGSGFAAAILDTGIDLDHSFFGPDAGGDGVADRIVFHYDFADNDADASDRHGHGSNVSSIVASSDATYTGVAPGADIIHLKVFSDAGGGSFAYVEQALRWVVDNAAAYNIASVNMSLGDGGNYAAAHSLYGIADEIAALASLDVITVSASGNRFYEVNSLQGVSYPAADPYSLAVGAVYDSDAGGFAYAGGAKASSSDTDVIAPFSQRHTALTDVFAPGAPITGADYDGGTVTMHGTSQAAPQVAGLAVLAQQLATEVLGRRLTVEEFTDLLAQTGVAINDGDDENDNVDNTGLDFSRIDAMALGDAILAMVEPTAFLAIAAADAVKAEGDTGSTAFTFTVTRTGDTSIESEVSYAATGSGADAADAADFGGAMPSGSVRFAAGETAQTITVVVDSDFVIEGDEGFTVTLTGPTPGTAIETATAEATILNDDDATNRPTVVEARVSSAADDAEERSGGSVSLSSTDLELVTDKDAQTVGIRFAGVDVPPGAIIVGAYLQFQADETDSGDTTLVIRGQAAGDAATFSGADFDVTSRPATAASAEWSPPAWDTKGESGAAQRSTDLTAVVQEIVEQGGWSAGNAMAFVISGSGKRVAESYNGDTGAAPLLHVEYLAAEGPAGDPAPSYAISAADAVLPEGDAGMTAFTFTVTRDGDVSGSSEISYAVTGGGADGADFGGALPSGTVSFAAGEASRTIAVEVAGDSDVEADEGFTVTLSNPSDGGAIVTASADGLIQDDDAAAPAAFVAIEPADAIKPEGDSGATAFLFRVTRSGDTSGPVDVSYAVTGNGADAADFGGALPSGTVSFGAGETVKTIAVEVAGDTDFEADEGFTVTLLSPSGGAAIASASAAATIENDDPPPADTVVIEMRVSSSSDDAEEDASGGMDLSSSDLELIDDRGDQTVGLRFAGIDVPQGATIVGAYLQFQVDETDAEATDLVIRGEAAGDAAAFSTAAFDVTSRALTSASAAWAPPAWQSRGDAGPAQRSTDLTAIVQEIVDQGGWSAANAMAFVISGSGKRVAESFDGDADAAPLLRIEYQAAPPVPPSTFLAIEAADATGPEGDDGATAFLFTVTRTGDLSVATDVAYSVTGSGAEAADAADFGGTLPSGTVAFAPGETSGTVAVDVAGDSRFEADEGFAVTLSQPSAGAAITTDSAEGTILNDDEPSQEPVVFEVRVSATSDDAEESASGGMSLSSSDLELVAESSLQTVGLRFDGIQVPPGAVIVDAYIRFQADETDSGAATLEIRAEAANDAAAFSSSDFDISSRPLTSASATWSPPNWDAKGEQGPAQQTPGLAAIVQEIVDRAGWAADNAMAFVIFGSGKRVAESFDGVSGAAPLLHIEYDPPLPADADLFF